MSLPQRHVGGSRSEEAIWIALRRLKDKFPARAFEIERAASEIEINTGHFYATPKARVTKEVLIASWARARNLYSALTGTPLI